MTKVLIAYDGSPCSNAAIDDIKHAALPDQIEARVISVADVWLPSETEPAESSYTTPPAVAKMRAQARLVLENARELAAAGCQRLQQLHPGWKLTPMAVADSPAWAIIRQADTWPADLVLVGSHGRSILERLFLGSVAERVVAEAKCSVRICRPRQSSGTPRLMVAVDGSAGSEAAVREVAARCWPAGTTARVIAVIDPRLQSAIAWPGVYADRWMTGNTQQADEWVCGMTAHFSESLRAAGIQAESHIFNGDPKHVVLKQAEDWNTDTIFIGARGLQHGDRLYLGTFASSVAARAHCSVEVVRPSTPAG